MLNVHTLTLGAYQTNCYIIHHDRAKTCCVIDPGYNPETVLDQVYSLGLTVEAVLLTHGHFDHVGGVKDIAAETGCQVYLCGEDLSMPPQLTAGPLYYTNAYGEGDQLRLAGLDISVIHTPGHTPGGVSLRCQDALFTGDTLFCGSCGRTDFPGGDMDQQLLSLKKLCQLEGDYEVYPGHMDQTTLERERQFNYYCRMAMDM